MPQKELKHFYLYKVKNTKNDSVPLRTMVRTNSRRFVVQHIPISSIFFGITMFFQIISVPKDKITYLKSKAFKEEGGPIDHSKIFLFVHIFQILTI